MRTYIVTIRSTGEPLGLVNASHQPELFMGAAALADEAGLDISQVEVRDLATPSWPGAVIEWRILPSTITVRVGP